MTHVTMGMNLEDIMLNERSQAQKDKYYRRFSHKKFLEESGQQSQKVDSESQGLGKGGGR